MKTMECEKCKLEYEYTIHNKNQPLIYYSVEDNPIHFCPSCGNNLMKQLKKSIKYGRYELTMQDLSNEYKKIGKIYSGLYMTYKFKQDMFNDPFLHIMENDLGLQNNKKQLRVFRTTQLEKITLDFKQDNPINPTLYKLTLHTRYSRKIYELYMEQLEEAKIIVRYKNNMHDQLESVFEL
jgi:hypothetical protein